MREDSVRSDKAPTVQIGCINDPVFGKSTAGLFTQVIMPGNLLNVNFGTGAVLDSAVFSLAYRADFYGDTTAQQTFRIYQLTQDMNVDSAYFSNRPKQYFPTVIGSALFTPHPKTRTVVGADTLPPHLRIRMDQNFAQTIFSQSGNSNLANNQNFLQFLKGLYIAPDSNLAPSDTGAILQFNPTDTLSRLTFYYHNSTQDSLRFNFEINTSCAYYSYFTHNYSTATGTINQQLSMPNGTYNEVYVQSLSGLKTKILFPYLDKWKNLRDANGNPYRIAINQAELVIKADPSQALTHLPLNTNFYVVRIDSFFNQHFITDMTNEAANYFDGALNTTTNEYHINMARYFNALINEGLPNNGIYLKDLTPVDDARRGVLGSSISPNYKMYLHLVFTRIN